MGRSEARLALSMPDTAGHRVTPRARIAYHAVGMVPTHRGFGASVLDVGLLQRRR